MGWPRQLPIEESAIKVARSKKLTRKVNRLGRYAWRVLIRGLLSTDHPILAHIVPMRRCNLSCGYCNEFDKTSDPVPLESIVGSIDKLAELGTAVVTCSGGEPMMHPHLLDVIRHIRKRGMVAGLLTNGMLLTPAKIQRLNDAGLDELQISIDNVAPDDISTKSLKLLDKRLGWLRDFAYFAVRINSVIGSNIERPGDALTIAKRAKELGFAFTLGIAHDHQGQLHPLCGEEQSVYWEINCLQSRIRVWWERFGGIRRLQDNMVVGKENDWRCRAGSRYLYVSEFGDVHWCSQQRGSFSKPLTEYSRKDIRYWFDAAKPCASSCTIGCSHRVARLDFWRRPQGSPPCPTAGSP